MTINSSYFISLTYGEHDGLDYKFHPDHLMDLRNSGLTDRTIKNSHAWSLSPRDFSLFVFGNRKINTSFSSALCFPYLPDVEFARIKIFPPYEDAKGHKTKYLQPPGTSSHLYTPQKIDLSDVITIIEGEKKTLAGIQYGLNAIGIGGIWNWVNTSGYLNGDFKKIDWKDKQVDIVPDSDVWNREDLLRAVLAFVSRLKELGAEVIVVRMDPEREKGLDDFFVAGNTIDDYNDLERVTVNSQFFDRCQTWFSQWKKEKAQANICPYCDKGFKNLKRHKCKKKPE